jgi:hypothetical protein
MLRKWSLLQLPSSASVNKLRIKLSIFILAMAEQSFCTDPGHGMPFNEIFLFVVAIAVAAFLKVCQR